MHIVAIYIEEFKGIENKLFSLESSYSIKKEENIFSVKKRRMGKSYYQGNYFNLILGQNGVGKTTILEFIEGLYGNPKGLGFGIFYDKGSYKVISNTIELPLIESDKKVSFIDSKELRSSALISINNIFDLSKYYFKEKTAKQKNVVHLTNNAIANKGRLAAFRDVINTQLVFFKENKGFLHDIGNPNPQFVFNWLLPTKSKFLAAIRNIPNYIQKLDFEIEDFYESYFEKEVEKVKLHEENNRIRTEHDAGVLTKEEANKQHLENIAKVIFNRKHYKKIESNNDLVWTFVSFFLSDFVWNTADAFFKNKEERNAVYLSLVVYGFNNLGNFQNEGENYLPSFVDASLAEEFYEVFNEDSEPLLDLALCIEEFKIPIHSSDVGIYFHSANSTAIESLVLHTNKVNTELSREIEYGWSGFSSGEFALINLFSRIYNAIFNMRKKGYYNFTFLIDELDLYLHPEWQRSFLNRLFQLISSTSKSKKETFQFILTTHSPIIASDFLPEDITIISKDKGGIEVTPSNIGFGTSINELYLKSFALDSTIGEYSRDVLEEIFKKAELRSLSSTDTKLVYQIGDELLKEKLLGYINSDQARV